ncbi:MAG: cellulase family glycosylhydrolase [Candidatus Saccharimonadales bacterium]
MTDQDHLPNELNAPEAESLQNDPAKKPNRRKLIIFLSLGLAVIGLGILGYFLYSSLSSQSSSSSSSSPTTIVNQSKASFPGPYRVVGNQILAANNNRFIPYGFVLECMAVQAPVNQLCQKGTNGATVSGMAQVEAARNYWDATALRFQVSRCTLYSQSPYNSNYLNLVDTMVNETNKLGMVAIVTLQEEQCDSKTKPFPDATSVTFWNFMANHFKNNPNVFFDLFNEPRLQVGGSVTENDVWNIWQNGGYVNQPPVNDTFVGMQTLVNDIRGLGANNIIIAESNNFDHDLTQIMTHLLKGSNIAYGVEPNPGKHNTTESSWNQNFGQYTNKIPILSEAFLDNYGRGNCSPDSPTVVPQLLPYLASHGMGVLAWTLESGLYIINGNLDQPTTYGNATTINCPKGKGYYPNNTIGAGQDLLNFFHKYSPYGNSQ